MDYKLLQLTNKNVGAVLVNSYLPLGYVTGRINCPYNYQGAIYYTTSSNDTIIIGTKGHYKLKYNASLTTATAGTLSISLLVNGTSVYSISQTTTEGGIANLDLDYEFKVTCSNVPTNVQLQLTGVATTAGTSNIIVEKLW